MNTGRTIGVIVGTAAITAVLVWLLVGRANQPVQPQMHNEPLNAGLSEPPDLDKDGPITESNRYQMSIDLIDGGNRDHFLVDTATGAVWYVRLGGPGVGQAVFWQKTIVHRLPKVESTDVGRFSIHRSASVRADRFLFDSATGMIWLATGGDGKRVEFHVIEVEELHKEGDK